MTETTNPDVLQALKKAAKGALDHTVSIETAESKYKAVITEFSPVILGIYPDRDSISKNLSTLYKKAILPVVLTPLEYELFMSNKRMKNKEATATNNRYTTRVAYVWDKLLDAVYGKQKSSKKEGAKAENTEDNEDAEDIDLSPCKRRRLENALKDASPGDIKEALDKKLKESEDKQAIIESIRTLFE